MNPNHNLFFYHKILSDKFRLLNPEIPHFATFKHHEFGNVLFHIDGMSKCGNACIHLMGHVQYKMSRTSKK
jgi:hypothetical protein